MNTKALEYKADRLLRSSRSHKKKKINNRAVFRKMYKEYREQTAFIKHL